MASDLKRKADSKGETGPLKKKKRINPKNNAAASTLSYSTITQLSVPKRTSARAKIDVATNLISNRGRNGGQIGKIAARAKTDATRKSSISSDGSNCIAARVKIDPRVMMKGEIRQDLVQKAVNCVLRAKIFRPRSNPVQRHRRMNFNPTRSRFHPDFTSTPPLVAAKSGNEDLVRRVVSWLMKARLSTSTCSISKPTTIRTAVRTLRSGCLFNSSQSVIISS